MRFARTAALAAALVIASSAPGSGAGDDGIAVGVILPLSGSQAALGRMQKNSMIMAAEVVNKRGGINGVPLVLDIRDSKGRAAESQALIDHFARDKNYPLVLGGGSSSLVATMSERSRYRGIPLVSITGSKDGITENGPATLFRIAPPRSEYVKAVMKYAGARLGSGRIALWCEASDYGNSMAEVVRKEARKRGWDLSWEGSFEAGISNLQEDLDALEAARPDAVFLCAFPPDDVKFVKEMRGRLGKKTEIFNLVPASSLSGSLAACGEECLGVHAPSLWLSSGDEAAWKYEEDYRDRYGSAPDYHGAQAYAAVRVAATCLMRAGAEGPEKVREALKGLGVSTPYGYVTFPDRDGYSNQNDPPNYVVRWNGSGFERVEVE